MPKGKGRKVDPGKERAKIGTPAGENPEEGRKRHGTEPLTEDMSIHEAIIRRAIEDDIEALDEEEFAGSGYEISATGGITGTHVMGGATPRGGNLAGGTPGTRRHYPTVEEKT